MSDVFVSYKAEDRRQVRPLVEALKADGFSVWWDEQIGGGAAWRNSIEAELDAAKCVIVVWSERSAGPGGSFVRDEASRAMERDVYLPIMLDASRLPLGFGETQALPLNGWKGKKSDPRYQAVVGSLRSIIEHKPLPPQSHAKARFPRRAVLIGGSSAFAVAAAGGGWYLLDRSSPAASNSIAVLPFANLSGDPSQAYFSDGMAEELRTSLARLGGLKVIGRTSSEMVRGDDAETAAKKLAVANILTGSVRRSPATIRVTAQLIDGTTGIESWTQDYDRVPGDTIKIQTDIAQSVAQALKIALGNAGRAALTVGGTNNVDAQNLVLQVDALLHSIFNEKRARRGIELLNAAIVRDPNYAGAYARRAVLLNTVSMFFSDGPSELLAGRSQALESANKAISLAPTLGWAHLALAQVRSAQLQMTPAWAEYRKALRFGPSDANTMRLYARFLAQIGRQQEALGLVDQALALDPLSAESYNFRLFVLYHARRFADAERTERELGIRSPNLFNPPIEYAYCLIVLGQFAAARQSLARAPANNPGRLTGEAILLARTGDRDGARVSIEKLKQAIGQNASYSIAEIHAQLGEPEEAFAALDHAFENTDWGLINLLTDPFMDPIRHDLRFRAALARLNYP
jgi:TolB-like protein/tetratricopeptide (TPR) repeat protein